MGSYEVITYEGINMNLRFIKQTVLILLLLPTAVFASEVDLSLEVTSPQGVQTIGTTVPFYFQITNNSNTTATNIVFENNFSSYINMSGPDLTFISANSSQGNCTLIEYIITCNISNISSSDIVGITIEMQIEYVGELSMIANISSDQTDNNKLDNSGKAIVNVSAENVKAHAFQLEWGTQTSFSYRNEHGAYDPSLSADGKYVSFHSQSGLASGANNNYENIYTVNRDDLSIEVTSIPNSYTLNYQQANGVSVGPAISNDGNIISFSSSASNIIDNDSNNKTEIFAHIRSTNETYRVTESTSGEGGNQSGRDSDISGNGRYITFLSASSNLVSNDNNETIDIFIHDTNDRSLYRLDLENVGIDGLTNPKNLSLSENGNHIAFVVKQGEYYRVYLWSKNTGQAKQISLNETTDGNIAKNAGYPQISDDAKFITYTQDIYMPNSNIYLYDIYSEETKLVSTGINSEYANGSSRSPSISGNGRYIVYDSSAHNLIENDTNGFTDVFIYDAVNKITKRVNKGVGGFQTKNHCAGQTISADGSTVAYITKAHNLVFGDDNQVYDIFIANNPFLTAPAKQVDLSISKAASASEIEIGKNITYTLTVDNISVDPEAIATEVSIEDILPDGLVFDSVTHPDSVTCSENSGTVSCDLGDIAVDDPSVSIEIIAKATTKGEIKNTATVSASEGDSDTSNNKSEATINVIEPTDAYINGSIDDSVTYYIGDELTYSFEVGNNNDIPATDVTATIDVPTGISISSATTDIGTCSVTGQKITCIFGDEIGKTDKANITVKATPSAAGSFDVNSEVKISETQTDSDTENNSNTVKVTIKPKADLEVVSIEDSDDPDDGSIYAGTNLTYTITVKNTGPSDATNVKIKDTLPTGVTFVSASTDCAYASGVVNCDITSLKSGASTNVDVVIKPTVPETITNTVTVTAYEHDHVVANDSAYEDTLVKAVADMEIISVTASPAPPSLVLTGNELTYTFKIKNNGINDATEVELKDTLPDGMEFVLVGSSAGCSETAGEVTCNIGNLTNGAEKDIYIVVKPAKPGIFTNEATVSAKEHDDNNGNNKKDIDVEVKAVTDMQIISASATTPLPVYAGANLTYSVKIKNNAAEFNTAENVKVTYAFKGDIVFAPTSSCIVVGNDVTCDIGSMTYNQVIEHKLIIKPDMDGDLTADITVSSTTHDPDTSEASNSKSVTTTVTPAVDLAIGLSDSPDPVLVGQDLTYTITVTNNGPSTATNVVLQDILPAAAPVQSVVTSQGTCINNLTTLDCNLDNIADDGSVKIILVLRPTNGAAGTLTNEATVSSDTYERPTTPDNNVASVSTTVNQSSKLKVSLKGKGSGTVDITVNGTETTCPGDCEGVFTRGDKVKLEASSGFDRWQGGVCSGKINPCKFTLDKPNMNVSASFK